MASLIGSNEEWISALEAAKLLARRFGGLTIAKHAIATGLREGLLRARAEWAAQVNEGDEDLTEIDATPEKPIEIPTQVWCASANWESDRLRWDWEYGCFEVEGHFVEDGRDFGGVSFLKSEIEEIDPNSHTYASLVQPRTPSRQALDDVRLRRSASPPKWDWKPAFADLIAIANCPDGLESELGLFRRGFQGNLEKWFAKWFSDRFDDAPSEDQCRIHARLIVSALQAHAAAEKLAKSGR